MKYLKISGYNLLYIIISTLIVTIINYFNILNNSMVSIIKLFIPLITIFISGIKIAKLSNSKGYINGLKIGLIFIFILFIYNLLFIRKFDFEILLYYLLMIISSMFGGIIGIDKTIKE